MPATAETVADYLAHLADQGRKVSTIERRLVTLDQRHRAHNLASPSEAPLVRMVCKGLRRVLGVRPERKAPILVEDLDAMLAATLREGNSGLAGLRDRALVLIGFGGALRRSELVALDVSDVDFSGDGLVVCVRHSKVDPEGQGRSIGIPRGSRPERCPVRALQA